ncbi:hypothetical protein L541_2286 [Bordetella hinzii CA90 BAL1384]|uniref:Uncharacterized protein n=1 Tax=Bordetella hinzii OH87 BAL007II TaxID=1331262 RepID=A0ABR4R4Z0_9BORD|nr:hypothetical protein L544_1951 [Bordetella hinzii OH87 BAL007II]KCB30869.1 hypothetical protein L541_2286 [Bordetella hinzii CA90 BAL1384]KCB33912.1 hypothetical protein L543_2166 [Bordetella hinzii L60]KCB39308.1 hypothetical protein L539_2260 [Bordetella hinzii 5132]KCB48356.1 hypothetical protein L538_2169 [Bordetella hinzii 4161]KCB51073.1 hypothetical protein L537_2296 [Bordetella hinzii 1277]
MTRLVYAARFDCTPALLRGALLRGRQAGTTPTLAADD